MHRVWRIRPDIDYEEDEMNIYGYVEKYEKALNLTPSKYDYYFNKFFNTFQSF